MGFHCICVSPLENSAKKERDEGRPKETRLKAPKSVVDYVFGMQNAYGTNSTKATVKTRKIPDDKNKNKRWRSSVVQDSLM